MEYTDDKMLEMLQKEYDAIQDIRYKGVNIKRMMEDFNVERSFAEQVMGRNILIRHDKLEWQY